MTEQGIFDSTHHALAFAFNPERRTSAPNLLQKLADKDKHRPQGQGLSGLDAAAQAGMILREVTALPELQQAILTCKFAKPVPCEGGCGGFRDKPVRREAIEILAQHTLTVLQKERPNLMLRRSLVRKYFGDKTQMQDVAKACGVHPNTVTAHMRAVKKVLQGLERQALAALDDRLKALIVSEEEAVPA